VGKENVLEERVDADTTLATSTQSLSLSSPSAPLDLPTSSTDTPMEYDGYILQAGESPVPLLSCLFCTNFTFTDLPTQLSHMHKSHGFFLPFPKTLTDCEGLLIYLGEKVGIGHTCVYCNARFTSTIAVRQHMKEKSHAKMRLDNDDDEEEYMDFYDFSSLNNSSSDSSGNDSGKRRLVGINESGELLMTDGSTIGHRQYQRVYNQNVRLPKEEEEEEPAQIEGSVESEGDKGDGKVIVGNSGAVVLKGGEKESGRKYRESWVRKNERRLALKIGMRNNSQQHYRAQVLF